MGAAISVRGLTHTYRTPEGPLASGQLSGKYLDEIPAGSRAALPGYEWLQGSMRNERRNAKVRKLQEIANELGCTLAQLSIAWCARNPRVSTVITGASRVEQIHENLKALDVLARLDREVMARVEAALA